MSLIDFADFASLYQIEDNGLKDIFDGTLLKARKKEESSYSQSLSEILGRFKSILATQKGLYENLAVPDEIFQNSKDGSKEKQQGSHLDRRQGQKQKKNPDPSHFELKSHLEDESGFKVLGCSHIFRYDEHRGWYINAIID